MTTGRHQLAIKAAPYAALAKLDRPRRSAISGVSVIFMFASLAFASATYFTLLPLLDEFRVNRAIFAWVGGFWVLVLLACWAWSFIIWWRGED